MTQDAVKPHISLNQLQIGLANTRDTYLDGDLAGLGGDLDRTTQGAKLAARDSALGLASYPGSNLPLA